MNLENKKYDQEAKEVIANNIRFFRKEILKMNQRRFANRYGIPRASVGAYEEGRAGLPKRLLDVISLDMGVTIRQFMRVKFDEESYKYREIKAGDDQVSKLVHFQEQVERARDLIQQMDELKNYFKNYNPI